MKKLFKFIRYRICRSIYYADWCPMENRKDYNRIAKNIMLGAVFSLWVAIFMMGIILISL